MVCEMKLLLKKKKKSLTERSDVYEEEWKEESETSPPSSLRKNNQRNKKVKEKQAEAEASQFPATSSNRLQREQFAFQDAGMTGGNSKKHNRINFSFLQAFFSLKVSHIVRGFWQRSWKSVSSTHASGIWVLHWVQKAPVEAMCSSAIP